MHPLPSHATILVVPLPPLDHSHARELIHRLRSHSSPDAAPQPSRSPDRANHASVDDSHDQQHLPWRIRNKYYSAHVQFKLLEYGQAAGQGTAEGDEPAVVVLAQADVHPPEALRPLLASLSSRPAEFEVALVVSLPPSSLYPPSTSSHSPSSSPTPSPSPEINEELWDDLALDHGFEWIHLASTSRPSASTSPSADERDEDDDEVRRIVGALQAHMWEGMERVEPTRREPRPSQSRRRPQAGSPHEEAAELDENEEDEDEDEDFSALGAPPLPEPRHFVAPPMSFPSTFLPSIPRNRPASSSAAPHPISDTTPGTNRVEASSAFDDDFAPFVAAPPPSSSAASATCFPPLPSVPNSPQLLATSSGRPTPSPSAEPLYRHPSFSFPDSSLPPVAPLALFHSQSDSNSPSSSNNPGDDDDAGGSVNEADLDDLDALFSRLRAARDDMMLSEGEALAGGAGADDDAWLERRRERAERMLQELLGGL
ncbi:hypothetical protein JCM5296_004538 [Sporobolomyces johnsonii]